MGKRRISKLAFVSLPARLIPFRRHARALLSNLQRRAASLLEWRSNISTRRWSPLRNLSKSVHFERGNCTALAEGPQTLSTDVCTVLYSKTRSKCRASLTEAVVNGCSRRKVSKTELLAIKYLRSCSLVVTVSSRTRETQATESLFPFRTSLRRSAILMI